MATIGLDDLYYATITEGNNGDETYGTPVKLAKAISAEVSTEIAEAILNEVGIKVESVVNGQEAVDRTSVAKPGEFDLVLMDIQMPVMDGYTATTKIRELEDASVAYVPIVAMTANAFDEDRKETMNMGMNGHISKPIDIDEMLSTMKKCMGL